MDPQKWRVVYSNGSRSRDMGTRDLAVSLACEQLWRPDGNVKAVEGPDGVTISRAQLETLCKGR